jgi:hypothetical protein
MLLAVQDIEPALKEERAHGRHDPFSVRAGDEKNGEVSGFLHRGGSVALHAIGAV